MRKTIRGEGLRIRICEHVKMSHGRCGSPAMRGQRYCYYHGGAHREMPPANLLAALGCPGHETDFRLSSEQRYPGATAAVQRGFFQLFHALAHNEIDLRRATLLLASLHRATRAIGSSPLAIRRNTTTLFPAGNEVRGAKSDDLPVTWPNSRAPLRPHRI
jgi:hypothetical protein